MSNRSENLIACHESIAHAGQADAHGARLTWRNVLSAIFLPVMCGDVVLTLPDTAWLL